MRTLYPFHQYKNEQDEQYQSQPTRRVVAPVPAVWPRGQCTDQDEDKNDNKDGGHGLTS